jgi:hypothetical protein
MMTAVAAASVLLGNPDDRPVYDLADIESCLQCRQAGHAGKMRVVRIERQFRLALPECVMRLAFNSARNRAATSGRPIDLAGHYHHHQTVHADVTSPGGWLPIRQLRKRTPMLRVWGRRSAFNVQRRCG